MKIKVYNDNSIMTIKSDHKLEDIRLVQKYEPSALCIVNWDNEPVFGCCVAKTGNCRLNDIGVEYSPEVGPDGLAKVTIGLPAVEDVKKYITETYGVALDFIRRLDANIADSVETVRGKRESINDLIEIVD